VDRGRIRKRACYRVKNQGSRILPKDLSNPDIRGREARVHLNDHRIVICQDQIDPDIPLEARDRSYHLLGPTERQGAERMLERDAASMIPEPIPSSDLLEVEGQGERSTAVSEERDAGGNAVDVGLREQRCTSHLLPGRRDRPLQFRLLPRDEDAVTPHPVDRLHHHGVAEPATYRCRVISRPKAERPGGRDAARLQQSVCQHLVACSFDAGSTGTQHQLATGLDHPCDRFEQATCLRGYQERGIRLLDHLREALMVAMPAVNNLKSWVSRELWKVPPIDLH